MADNLDDPRNGQALYSEDDADGCSPPTTSTALNKPTKGLSQGSSTSSLSEALDPDADAEGEPDDLDADADGIEDDDVMDYSFDPPDRVPPLEEDDEDGSGEEEMEDPEDEDAEEEEDDSGEEMDLDENASSPPPSPPSRASELPHDSTTNKKPLVLKLKLGSQTSTTAPPTKRKYIKKPSDFKSPSGRSRLTNDKKAGSSLRRRDTDEDDDELADDALESDSETDDDRSGTHIGLYQAWDESDGASTGDDAIPTAGQLTVRQRAKEYGEPVTDLQSLPMSDGKKKKELTEADRAMEKAEKSRKRKHQNEKKLEDEKTETINRLLKGQIGKAGKGSSSKIAGGSGDPTEEANNQVAKTPAPPPLPTMIRRLSSIRSGEYVSSLSVPPSILDDQQAPILFKSSPNPITYPPKIRPPPKTWKLVNGVRVN